MEEETILNSAADLAKWAQAGPGGLNWDDRRSGGFARTFGGLGMPWYPVKDYGDFSLKFQWRDSSTGSNGNGGVFVRFPNPAEAVDSPGRRTATRARSARARAIPAWVAIYCGHEIQINDNQPSEPQKTGSVYNFSPLNATQAKVQPQGHVGRLRDQGRRPDVHDHPQRRGAAGVREHPGQAVLALG